ncbi:hypothetical protein [Paenibacillus aceris]|uniref:Uncharacterized protein n=1 Tax=Paenibacillus aceris TaxID=869555 RepID=A0ABS4I5L2_9BACL|nr:hypothetical protein [Paenibacillus aceris]MBP1966202.1 hypothetical protein [Paenibacillus aceris]NHW33355.1 hypothetical protein [Paenibacillus aceris]
MSLIHGRHLYLKWTATNSGTDVCVPVTDIAGNVQPETADWNKKGYGYNDIQKYEFM